MRQSGTRTSVAAAVGAALLLGIVGGVLLEDRRDLVAADQQDAAPAQVTVGALTDAPNGAPDGRDFELPVFNPSQIPIEARVTSLAGTVDSLVSGPARRILPGRWGVVGFSVAVNCDTGAGSPIRQARLTVRSDERPVEVDLALPGEGEVLVDYHRDFCRQGVDVTSASLAGVWILDRAYGEDLSGFLGAMTWRFGRDGSFVGDPEGGLFTADTALVGTYRVTGELLTIDVDGGYGCGAAGEVVWRVVVDGNDRMTMAWVRGSCPDGEDGDLWVMRRVLRDVGLPEPH